MADDKELGPVAFRIKRYGEIAGGTFAWSEWMLFADKKLAGPWSNHDHIRIEPLYTTSAVERLSAIEQERDALREALMRSTVALDDWLNLYASDHCDEARVREAQERVMQYGIIGYIAHVQEQNSAALRSTSKET